MSFYPSTYWTNPYYGGNMVLLDFKRGDINGDYIFDNIFLLGEKPQGLESPFVTNITLLIQDGSTNNYYSVVPKNNSGYNPTIFLGDFTGDHISNVLISIDSGGSGGYAFYYIYSFSYNIPNEIFNYEEFNEKYKYNVSYQNYYQVKVTGSASNSYIIDLAYKDEEYLSEIYYKNGILKEPIEGWVNPLGGLWPVDFQRNGIYGLYTTQSIAGRYNADTIGYVQTSLEWKDNRFVPFLQTVGILGANPLLHI